MNPAENERKKVTLKVKDILKQKRWILLFTWILFIYGSFIYFFEKNILWESVGETFFRIFLLLVIILVNIGLGKKVFKWVNFKISSFLESSLFSFGIGLTLFTYIVIILGLTRLFNKWIMTLVLLGLFIFCYREIEDVVHQIKMKWRSLATLKLSFFEIILLFILFIQIIFNLAGANTLPSSWDALSVYLPLPEKWIEIHSIAKYGESVSLPHNITILYAVGLLLKDAILAKLIHFILGIFTLIGVYALSRKYFSRRVALISAAVFYTIPLIMWESTTAYIDLGFTFYTFLAFYAFMNWVDSHKNGWLIISAIMSGMGIGSKITGFLYAGILFIGIIIITLLNKEKIGNISRNLLLFFIIVVLSGAFWYGRYFVLTGGSPSSLLSYLGYILKGGPSEGRYFAVPEVATTSPLISSLTSYLLLPWNLTMHLGRFPGYGGGTIGLLFLSFLPLLIFSSFRKKKIIKISLLFSLLYLIFWVFCAPYKRGLVPIFPLLSIMVAYIISRLSNFSKFFNFFLSFIMILTFIFQIFYLSPDKDQIYVRMLVFAGLKSQEEYILQAQRRVGSFNGYSLFKFVNERLSSNDKIFIVNESRNFYCNIPYVTRVSSLNKNPLEALKKAGITFILVDKYLEKINFGGSTNFLKEIEENLQIIYNHYPYIIYRIQY